MNTRFSHGSLALSNSSTPEKFISIEYNKWENFYKPLEENYKKLEKEFELEKKDKQVYIHIAGSYGYYHYIGKIDIWGKIDIEQKNALLIQLINSARFGERDMIQKSKKLILSGEEEIKEINKLTAINDEKISKIPKLIRWLFNIKTTT